MIFPVFFLLIFPHIYMDAARIECPERQPVAIVRKRTFDRILLIQADDELDGLTGRQISEP
ncbi:MAG: hypothetical protein LUQ25_01105 [Methanoregulaceae archaeon]|nr:hypothetical protein [Methanoregulaceae archaeon]